MNRGWHLYVPAPPLARVAPPLDLACTRSDAQRARHILQRLRGVNEGLLVLHGDHNGRPRHVPARTRDGGRAGEGRQLDRHHVRVSLDFIAHKS